MRKIINKHINRHIKNCLASLAGLCLCLGFAALSVHAAAGTPNKYASIIVDADTQEILHARNIDNVRYPASLTKMMTLYLTFDALDRGDLSLNEPLLISRRAARTPPVKLGLRAGRSIKVEQAILGLTVPSANDAAVVLAERLAGSEQEFAAQMTRKAKELGMQHTVFRNAHGLPNAAQYTTARDMAKLANALLTNHSKYYHYFGRTSFVYRGRRYLTHNTLLSTVAGVDGLKTGYTNASGYNLVISAKRNGRRLVAVVLGGASNKSRDQHMVDLIERGFEVQKMTGPRRTSRFALNDDVTKIRPISKPKIKTKQIQAYTLRASHNTPISTVRIVRGAEGMRVPARPADQDWAVQIGAFSSGAIAQTANRYARAEAVLGLQNAREQIIPVQRRDGVIYRARLAGLSHQHAAFVCKTLTYRGQGCLVIAPG